MISILLAVRLMALDDQWNLADEQGSDGLPQREPLSDSPTQQKPQHCAADRQADQSPPVTPHEPIQQVTQQIDTQECYRDLVAPATASPESSRCRGTCHRND